MKTLFIVELERRKTMYVVAEDDDEDIAAAEAEREADNDDGDWDYTPTYAHVASDAELADMVKHPKLFDFLPWGDREFSPDADLNVHQIAGELLAARQKAANEKAVRDANLKLFEGVDPQPIHDEEDDE